MGKWRWWVSVILVILLVSSNGYWMWKWRERMRVERVIDGDTLVMREGERVRLLGLDAPESGACLADEATRLLEKLVDKKIIRLVGNERDGFGRRLGIVRVGKINVNLEMIKSGLVRADSFEGADGDFLKAGETARENRLGLYGDICKKNNQEMCLILGNIDQSTGKKWYHLPSCRQYSRVRVNPERGERRFCTEKEAQGAGFSIAPECGK